MRLNKIGGILLAALMATVASASTIQPLELDNTAGMQVGLKVNGTEHNEWAGPFIATVDGVQTVEVFCLDFFTSIDYHQYTVTITAPSSAFQAAAQMYSTFVANFANSTPQTRALYGAALQIALWDVVIDGVGTPGAGMQAGNFQESTLNPFSNSHPNLEAVVNSYLSATLGPVAPGTVIYQSASQDIPMQTLIGGGGNGVPEPGTFLMLGGGLLAIGLIRRR